MSYKIKKNHTLREYNKKYGNRNLSEVSKIDADKKSSLLDGKKWWLIDDTYYEVPSNKGIFGWFLNLGSAGRIIICCLTGIGVVTAVAVPTIITFNNKNNTSLYTVTFDTDGGSSIPSQAVYKNKCATEPANPTKEFTLEDNYPFKEWQLDGVKFNFSTPITNNITLKASYNTVKWYDDNNYVANLSESNIGLTRGVMVNNQVHKVRLIGINHDDLADGSGNKAHTTWEFANLISDSNGYSLATQWHDTNDAPQNQDFLNSSIRKALTSEGNFTRPSGNNILFATKGETQWNNSYTNTILSMLPNGLQNQLKLVNKPVGTGTDYTETTYSDKLFLLSSKEMGYINANDKGFGETYSYYSGHTTETDAIRIKKQVNSEDKAYTNSVEIPDGKGQIYVKKTTKCSCVGGGQIEPIQAVPHL